MSSRRDFLKNMALGVAALSVPSLVTNADKIHAAATSLPDGALGRPTPVGNGLPITGTFLDEISYDIPHQNWGEAEWDRDFAHMKAIGIDMVTMIRCGHRKFITYPSNHLINKRGCYAPGVDLLDMFLRLAEKYDMKFWLGLYDHDLTGGTKSREVDDNRYVIEEVWEKYGRRRPAFGGWYLSREISRASRADIESYRALGQQCKDVSGGLPTFISPYIEGKKAVMSFGSELSREDAVSVAQHEREWDEIFDGIHTVVDACAFQDGHCDYNELPMYFEVNKRLADKYGITCWSNAETFDRDMPIKFLPIKWEKLRMKLEAARQAGCEKAITFEFSHFMSPQSAYLQAGHLYNRYKEYFGLA